MKFRFVYILIFSWTFYSCSSTRVIAEYPGCAIYINGKYKGNDEVKVNRSGLPAKMKVEAKKDGRVLGFVSVKRKFNISSYLAGVTTCGFGFGLFWKYPNEIIIPVDQTALHVSDTVVDPWLAPHQDNVWEQPVKK